MLSLRTLEGDALSAWLDRLGVEYAQERVAAGDEPERAKASVERNRQEFFPGEVAAPGQLVFRLVNDEGQEVGTLWIGRMPERPPGQWWVWTIEIEAPFRGRGFGRAAMELGEQEARKAGARRLGLNVFGTNAVARSLYESLGYEITELQMSKEL
ncbi:MAG TPA: GNAT family N-acetyltransferase [Solirubrobacteraceae bacterium]